MKNFIRQHPLPFIVIAQLFGTSLWFSINGVWISLSNDMGVDESALGYFTLMVQAGFITGTMSIAIKGLADRFKASKVFAVANFIGAILNVGLVFTIKSIYLSMILRFLTGICLAGIYPIGMKLVVSWAPKHAGAALSWLLGMLTLGTALPHLMRGITLSFAWQWTLLVSSLLAILGGILILIQKDGPYLPKVKEKVHFLKGLSALKFPEFRAVAGGYFGHCWELYAFWMLTPLLVTREIGRMDLSATLIPWVSFCIIAVGLVGCVGGGWLSKRFGSFSVAYFALFTSCIICAVYPLLTWLPGSLLLILLVLWGLSVIADSPQFAAMAAVNSPQEYVGSSLAVINAVGFALTIPSIWITSSLWNLQGPWVVWWLLPGSILGLLSLKNFEKKK
jgi:MFS family permease